MEKRISNGDLLINYINKYFDNREFIFCQLNNYSKLSSYISKKKIIIDDEVSELLLSNEKISKMFKLLNPVLVRLLEYRNLNSLLDMYCIKNNISLNRDVEVSVNSRNNSIDTIKLYLSEVDNYDLLTMDEEKELFRRISLGDEDARVKLVEHNLRLVIPIARSYSGNGLSFSDLVQCGNEGLVIASRKFDPNKNNRFSTYAVWWIRQSIDRSIADYGRAIRVPAHMHETMIKVNKAIRNYQLVNDGKNPSNEELSILTGIDKDKIKRAKDSFDSIISLSSPVCGDEKKTLEDVIVDNNSLIDEDREEIDKESLINEMILRAKLSEKEIYVIKCRNGFFGKILSLDEIGKELGVTRERIRQIEKKSLQKLASVVREKEEYEFGGIHYGRSL